MLTLERHTIVDSTNRNEGFWMLANQRQNFTNERAIKGMNPLTICSST